MRLRRGIVGAVQTADVGQTRVSERRSRFHFLRPRMDHRDIARRALLQEQFGRLNAWLGMKSRAHLTVEQDIRDRHDGHALMMRHVRPNDGDLGAVRDTRARVVERFMKAVSATRADSAESLEIAHRAFRIDHGGKRRGVGRDDGVLAQAAFEPQAGDTEI